MDIARNSFTRAVALTLFTLVLVLLLEPFDDRTRAVAEGSARAACAPALGVLLAPPAERTIPCTAGAHVRAALASIFAVAALAAWRPHRATFDPGSRGP